MKIRDSKIRDSKIRDSKIRDSKIRDSEIRDSLHANGMESGVNKQHFGSDRAASGTQQEQGGIGNLGGVHRATQRGTIPVVLEDGRES